MVKPLRNSQVCSLILTILMCLTSIVAPAESSDVPFHYQPLTERLSSDGFDPEFLSQLLNDARAELIPSLMTISLQSRETGGLYAQFFSPESILLSKNFLLQNLKILRKMEKQFHVDKEVVVAILLVESRFGENIGKYRVIPTLASMALMDSPANLQQNYQSLRDSDPELSFERIEGIAKRRAQWAYQELKCFFRIIRHENIDPLEVTGSYAGALGMAQFIPSSYLTYAQSKKGLGNWLHNKEEAIFSIANYLKSHGWRKNLSFAKKKRVIWCYNHSEPYVETILQVAQKIKQK